MDIILKVREIIGGSVLFDATDSQKVFEAIKTAIDAGNQVVVSFKDVEVAGTTCQYNQALGQLYSVYAPHELQAALSIIDVPEGDREYVRRSLQNAKHYFGYV